MSSLKKKFEDLLKKRCCTLLGVGPMSLNCVDSVLEVATEQNTPIMLIASRRQIDSEAHGSGYVNNWSTQEFANYVKNKDKMQKVILCRDHGGPWQNSNEIKNNLKLDHAMISAKKSFEMDIKAGFEILHLDPSIDIHCSLTNAKTLDRLFELYEYCFYKSKKYGKEILFEIGTEEQSGSTNTPDELEFTLSEIQKFCLKNDFPLPTFVVIQSGTRVKETRNIGSFDSPFRVANELPPEIQIPKMIGICKKYNILMKAHNTDYLSDEALSWYPRLGIHAANIAPEFGVVESRAFLSILRKNHLDKFANEFINLACQSRKWEKWVLDEKKLDMESKAIISGHYIFSTSEFKELKTFAKVELEKKDIDLDKFLKSEIKDAIKRYIIAFNLRNS